MEEAYISLNPPRQVLLAGGSYLVSERDPQVDTLVAISHLLGNEIRAGKASLQIEAGATVQELLEFTRTTEYSDLAECARWSCPSKNIRNQRTIGGEISRGRLDSDLYACLYALNPTMRIIASETVETTLRNWDGVGIIAHLELNLANLRKITSHRFALLPSAPAFVIVAAVQRDDQAEIVVAGRAAQLSCWSVPVSELHDSKIGELAASAAAHFRDDEYGAQAYKQKVIRVGLNRVRASL